MWATWLTFLSSFPSVCLTFFNVWLFAIIIIIVILQLLFGILVYLNNNKKTGHVIINGILFFSKLYDDGFATIPKLAEKLTIELVHHIQVK